MSQKREKFKEPADGSAPSEVGPGNTRSFTPARVNLLFLFKWGWFCPGSQTGLMDGSRLSDFSIERILSPQLGLGRTEPPQHHGRLADPGAPRGPPPLLLQVGLSFAEPCFQYFRRPDFSCACSTSGVHLHVQEAPGTQAAGPNSAEPGPAPSVAHLLSGTNFRVLARLWRRLH